MGWENVDKLNAEFEKLTIEQRYNYFEERMGELLGDIWRNWDDDIVEEELKHFKSLQENKNENKLR